MAQDVLYTAWYLARKFKVNKIKLTVLSKFENGYA